MNTVSDDKNMDFYNTIIDDENIDKKVIDSDEKEHDVDREHGVDEEHIVDEEHDRVREASGINEEEVEEDNSKSIDKVKTEWERMTAIVFHCNHFTMRSVSYCMDCKKYCSDGLYSHIYRFSQSHLNAVCLCESCLDGYNPILKLNNSYIYDIIYLLSGYIYGDIEWVDTSKQNDSGIDDRDDGQINIETFNTLNVKRSSGAIDTNWSFYRDPIGIKSASGTNDIRFMS